MNFHGASTSIKVVRRKRDCGAANSERIKEKQWGVNDLAQQ
jgi:hypothetical protein